jgi:branched-chain amino acid transport system permease protein
VGCFFGFLIGYVSTRRAGTIFAMISLGIGEMVTAMTLIFVNFFNGEDGIQTDRYLDAEPLGLNFGQQVEVYYLIAVWALIGTLMMYLYTRTPMGRMSNAVRDNPERVQFVGFNMQRIRWVSFTLAATFAGAAGALHAISYEQVGFETVSTIQSGAVLFMAYIGGVGVFIGPIIGAVVITLLQTTLVEVTKTWPFYFGLIFILVILFAPGGIAGILMLHQQIWRAGMNHLSRLAVPYGIAFLSTLLLAFGVVGLIEMLAHATDEFEFESGMELFWMQIDTAAFLPWFAFAVVTAIGAALCRRVYPGVASAYHGAREVAERQIYAPDAAPAEASR